MLFKGKLISSLVVIGTLMFVAASFTPFIAAQDVQNCPGGTMEASYEAPPPGMARYQTITFDENCKQIIGPVMTVPFGELPSYVTDPDAVHGRFESIEGLASSVVSRTWGHFYAE